MFSCFIKGKTKKKNCREPRHKNKHCSSGTYGETPANGDNTKQISVHPATSQNSNTSNVHADPYTNDDQSNRQRGGKSRSRHIEPPASYQDSAALTTMDIMENVLDDADVASHSSYPGYARAADEEVLIKPSGRLPPLDKNIHSASSSTHVL